MTNTVQPACDLLNNRNGLGCPLRTRKQASRSVTSGPRPPVAAVAASLPVAPPAPALPPALCSADRKGSPPSASYTFANGPTLPMSSLTEKDAQDAFVFIKKQKSRFLLNDNAAKETTCQPRAHLIGLDLKEVCSVRSAKIFAQGSRAWYSAWLSRSPLEVKVGDVNYRWDYYHVANVILRNVNGKQVPYVIDPLLGAKDEAPMPLEKWQALVKQNDKGVKFTYTSASTYKLGDAYKDDPEKGIVEGDASDDVRAAKSDYRKTHRD